MNKKQFVEYELSRVLRACNEDILACTYESINGAEYVTVLFKNNAKYHVDVTADSLIAILYDVVKLIRSK